MGKAKQSEDDPLLDPKFMDGPTVNWTVADMCTSNKKLFLTYHVMGAGYDILTPVGALVGGALYGFGVRPYPTALAMMGTSGLVAGSVGMALGLTKMSLIASKGAAASPPWTEEGIQQRVDGLSHNFKVRILDKSVWMGLGLATGALVMAGGPNKLRLSNGALGVAQALALGSAVGSFGAFGCIASTQNK